MVRLSPSFPQKLLCADCSPVVYFDEDRADRGDEEVDEDINDLGTGVVSNIRGSANAAAGSS